MKTIALVCLFSLSAIAAAPREGTFRRQGGLGAVQISKVSAAGLDFDIGTVNYQTNVCDIKGHADLKGGKAEYHAKATDPSDKCDVTLEFPSESTVSIGGQCDGLCGVNATFDGEFRLAADQCEEKARKARKVEFDKQYKAKKYKDALATLQADQKECDFYLDVFERAWLSSNLAVAAHHAGDDKACLGYLDALEKSGVTEFETPMHPKENEKLARALKTNRALCQKRAKS